MEIKEIKRTLWDKFWGIRYYEEIGNTFIGTFLNVMLRLYGILFAVIIGLVLYEINQ